MKFKNKRHIVVPLAIIIYTIVIAIYAWLRMYTPETRNSYFFVIGVNLSLAVVLYFILKKREDFRKNNKNNKKK